MNHTTKENKKDKEKKKFDYFIFAGEKSADVLGAHLIDEILKKNPKAKILAVAGSEMRRKKIHELFSMEKFQVMGFIHIIKALPKILFYFWKIKKTLLQTPIQKAIFIDSPDFALPLEKSLKKHHFSGQIIHYVCPSVWAWRKGRIKTLEYSLDKLFVLFPFEKQCFSSEKLKVHYVGHPLLKKTQDHISSTQKDDKKWIGLFPGSRSKEIIKNLPYQLEAVRQLSQNPNYRFFISVSQEEKKPLIEKTILKHAPKLFQSITLIPFEKRYDLMSHLDLALATSGTVNLELSFMKVPTIVHFAISKLDTFIAKNLLRINLPFYCIVNILADKEIFKELYGPNLSHKSLWEAIQNLLCEKKHYECIENCKQIVKDFSDISNIDELNSII
ncbi:MAG TPA: lipid-A-disaccharide synthase [Chlamydiales bacterium]|nr:lipid-A-disaccharide synthase [Chlamydiales bacterium]